MRVIGTRLHGVIDYLTAGILIFMPFLLDFADNSAATLVPVVLGFLTIGYSLLTDYELGAKPMIPMRTHIVIDMLVGMALIASPWVFLFAPRVFWPHLVIGIASILIAFMTDPDPRRPEA